MSKVLHCQDLGFSCGFVARGESEDEVLQQAAQHAEQVHDLHDLSPEVVAKVRAAIKDEDG